MTIRIVQAESRPAQSTIDAVMYSLRNGVAALSRADVRGRLAVIDEKQVREMIVLLQTRDGRIAAQWSDGEIEQLVTAWATCHGR